MTLVVRTDLARVTVLTLNRPGKLNAINRAMLADLRGHLEQLAPTILSAAWCWREPGGARADAADLQDWVRRQLRSANCHASPSGSSAEHGQQPWSAAAALA